MYRKTLSVCQSQSLEIFLIREIIIILKEGISLEGLVLFARKGGYGEDAMKDSDEQSARRVIEGSYQD